jgi:D-arabinose 5-phosphate isomerase GutQ
MRDARAMGARMRLPIAVTNDADSLLARIVDVVLCSTAQTKPRAVQAKRKL